MRNYSYLIILLLYEKYLYKRGINKSLIENNYERIKLSKKELSKKLQSKLTQEEVNIQKDIAPIIKEVKDAAPVIESLDKRKNVPLNRIETAVIDNIKQEEKKIKPKLSIEQMANDWIDVLKKTATHSVSVGKFEQNLNPLRKEYINELQTIYTDLIQQQRIDTAYISLQKQITNRGK